MIKIAAAQPWHGNEPRLYFLPVLIVKDRDHKSAWFSRAIRHFLDEFAKLLAKIIIALAQELIVYRPQKRENSQSCHLTTYLMRSDIALHLLVDAVP